MTGGVQAAQPILRAAVPDQDAALRRACSELEGVLFEQMLKALRETIPEGGVVSGGTGEEIFTGLMDGELSATAASRLEGSLGAALYRQLRGALGIDATTADPVETAPANGAVTGAAEADAPNGRPFAIGRGEGEA